MISLIHRSGRSLHPIGRMKSVFISPFRFYFVFLSILFAYCSLGGRLVHLQVLQSDRYSELAQNTRRNFTPELSRRGDLVDRKGCLLATTRSVVEVGLDPHSVDRSEFNKYRELASLLQIRLETLVDALERKFRQSEDADKSLDKVRWVKLKDEVDESTYRKIMNLGLKGIYGNRKYSRLYPSQNLASHVLGYVNKEGNPCMGVELLADYYLRGQDGWRVSEKDGRRREMPQFRSMEFASKDGLNVELTIDRIIQDSIESELRVIMDEYNPLSASVIVSEPRTGEILALANAPDFDPNRYGDYSMEAQRNRCLTDLYEPGSTFKIVPVGGVLNEGLAGPDAMVDCSLSTYEVGRKTLKLPRDHHPLGKITLREVVQKSSNRGAAQLGIRLGSERLYEYCRAFGFGEATGMGLTGERKGTLHLPENWDGLTITRLPMGHAVAVTPIQIHMAMSAVANDGILMRPSLIRRVFDHTGKTVVPFSPQPLRRVLEPVASSTLTEMLVSVVHADGTAGKAAIEGYEVAGKTGTTQKIIEGKYSNKHHVASFVGFLPADDPKAVITIVVDEPKMTKGRLGYGGSVAGPSFKRIASRLVGYMDIKPEDKGVSYLRLKNQREKSF